MSTRSKFRLGNVYVVLGGLWIVLGGQLSGCADHPEWFGGREERPRAEEQEHSQLADSGGPLEPGQAAMDEGDPPLPEALEARIREYIEQYSRDRDEQARPRGEVTTGKLVANRHADATILPPRVEPPATLLASTEAGRRAVVPGNGVLSVRPEAPAGAEPRQQAAPVVLSLSVEPDLLTTDGESGQPAESAPGEPNRGAEVSVVASPNDIHAIIDRLEAKVERDPNDLEAQIRLRLLYIAAGEDQRASAAPEGLAEETAWLVQSLAETIIETRNATTDLSLGAQRALQAARDFTHRLERYAQLAIPRALLCRRVDSYGVYDAIDPPSFVAGSPIAAVVYTEVENFDSELTEEEEYETRLTQRMELLDAEGRRVWEREDLDIVDVSRNRRQDFFLAPIIHLPGDLPAGTYNLRVEVQDLQAGKFTTAGVPLTILGSSPAGSQPATRLARRTP